MQTEKINVKKIEEITNYKENPYQMAVVTKWMESHNKGIFIGFYINKNDTILAAVSDCNTIYLLGNEYPTVMYAPRLLFHFTDSSSIKIDDVIARTNSIGNGSILMMALIELCKNNCISTITGYLSDIDNDHKIRRDNYYKKFGFKFNKNHIFKHL